jgi:hypothetical protein
VAVGMNQYDRPSKREARFGEMAASGVATDKFGSLNAIYFMIL